MSDEVEQPEAGETVYDLLDQTLERMLIRKDNTIVARYKNFTVRFKDYTVIERTD